MEKLTQLFIRACKSRNPQVRVRSVYRRFYGDYSNPEVHIMGILAAICDEFLELKVLDIISEMNPDNAWKYGKSDSYESAVIKFLTSKIRLSEVSRFEGLQAPLMFRRAA